MRFFDAQNAPSEHKLRASRLRNPDFHSVASKRKQGVARGYSAEIRAEWRKATENPVKG